MSSSSPVRLNQPPVQTPDAPRPRHRTLRSLLEIQVQVMPTILEFNSPDSSDSEGGDVPDMDDIMPTNMLAKKTDDQEVPTKE